MYVSRVKWSNPEKGVAPSPTPRCSSYWKGSLRVALDCSRQLIYYTKRVGSFHVDYSPTYTKRVGSFHVNYSPTFTKRVGSFHVDYSTTYTKSKEPYVDYSPTFTKKVGSFHVGYSRPTPREYGVYSALHTTVNSCSPNWNIPRVCCAFNCQIITCLMFSLCQRLHLTQILYLLGIVNNIN